MPLPATLKDGDYTISVCDSETNLANEATARPDRFAIRGVDELFSTLVALTGTIRNDALFVRLSSNDPGIAIGRTQLAKLPPSRRSVLGTSGRTALAVLDGSAVSIVPVDVVITGSAEATIRVKKKV